MILTTLVIIVVLLQTVSCGLIRDSEGFTLGNERISKRSIADEGVNEAIPAAAPLPPPRVSRSLKSDDYRHHDDLVLNIVPKAIFGERLLRKFVEETNNVLNDLEANQQNIAFKPQFRLITSRLERRPLM